MPMLSRPAASIVASGILCALANAQSLMLTSGEVVQAVGDAVPGLPGVTIGGTSPFSVPVVDLNGNILWRGRLAGTGITTSNDQAMFYGRTANDLVMWLQRGAAEPSGTLPGVTVNYLSTQWDNPRMSPEGGLLLFGSTLVGAGVSTSDDYCVFWGPIGGMQILAREGMSLASPVGAIISANISQSQDVTALNSSGTALIKVNISGGGVTSGLDDTGWLIGTPANLTWMCRENDLLPGGQLAVHSTLDGFRASMDELGRVVFSQSLSLTNGATPATAADNDAILLYEPANGLSVLVREGSPAAGSGGCVYGTINSSSGLSYHGLSRKNGYFTFTNSMTGGDVSSNTNDTSVFAGVIGGSIERVARESEAAPTGVPGEIYQALFPNGAAQINDQGTLVFVAQLGPTGLNVASDVAVFLAVPPYAPANVQMILREGDSVAGLPAGWVIGNTSGGGMTSSGTTLMINDRNTVVINVAGVGDPTAANWGVPAQIAWDFEHGARLAAMQGETYTIQASAQVMSAAVGTVIRSSSDGGNLSFNQHGDQVSRVFFTGTAPTAIMRNHIGSMVATPSSVPAAGGTPHSFSIDCGPAQANRFHLVLATGGGTRPGFPSPLGPQQVSLNFDAWSQLSLDFVNTAIWSNTFWFTDAFGRSTASFNLPPGVPGLLGLQLHHAAVLFDLNLASTFVTEPSGVRLY